MPRDSNGNTVPLPGTIVSTGDTVLPSQHNPMVNDVYAMMTQSLSRDGQGGMRANLDMHGFRILNVGPGEAATDGASVSQVQNGTPVGVVMDYAGSSAPATWMFAYGQAVSRTTYAALFAAIGTAFGSGDGTTTFNLPDLRGRVIAGKDDMGGADAGRMNVIPGHNTLGGTGGTDQHILTIGEMPAHNHGGETAPAGSHTHVPEGGGVFTINSPQSGGTQYTGSGPNLSSTSYTTSYAPNHVHAIYSQGSNEPHNNVQPTMIMNKIIKVSY